MVTFPGRPAAPHEPGFRVGKPTPAAPRASRAPAPGKAPTPSPTKEGVKYYITTRGTLTFRVGGAEAPRGSKEITKKSFEAIKGYVKKGGDISRVRQVGIVGGKITYSVPPTARVSPSGLKRLPSRLEEAETAGAFVRGLKKAEVRLEEGVPYITRAGELYEAPEEPEIPSLTTHFKREDRGAVIKPSLAGAYELAGEAVRREKQKEYIERKQRYEKEREKYEKRIIEAQRKELLPFALAKELEEPGVIRPPTRLELEEIMRKRLKTTLLGGILPTKFREDIGKLPIPKKVKETTKEVGGIILGAAIPPIKDPLLGKFKVPKKLKEARVAFEELPDFTFKELLIPSFAPPTQPKIITPEMLKPSALLKEARRVSKAEVERATKLAITGAKGIGLFVTKETEKFIEKPILSTAELTALFLGFETVTKGARFGLKALGVGEVTARVIPPIAIAGGFVAAKGVAGELATPAKVTETAAELAFFGLAFKGLRKVTKPLSPLTREIKTTRFRPFKTAMEPRARGADVIGRFKGKTTVTEKAFGIKVAKTKFRTIAKGRAAIDLLGTEGIAVEAGKTKFRLTEIKPKRAPRAISRRLPQFKPITLEADLPFRGVTAVGKRGIVKGFGEAKIVTPKKIEDVGFILSTKEFKPIGRGITRQIGEVVTIRGKIIKTKPIISELVTKTPERLFFETKEFRAPKLKKELRFLTPEEFLVRQVKRGKIDFEPEQRFMGVRFEDKKVIETLGIAFPSEPGFKPRIEITDVLKPTPGFRKTIIRHELAHLALFETPIGKIFPKTLREGEIIPRLVEKIPFKVPAIIKKVPKKEVRLLPSFKGRKEFVTKIKIPILPSGELAKTFTLAEKSLFDIDVGALDFTVKGVGRGKGFVSFDTLRQRLRVDVRGKAEAEIITDFFKLKAVDITKTTLFPKGKTIEGLFEAKKTIELPKRRKIVSLQRGKILGRALEEGIEVPKGEDISIALRTSTIFGEKIIRPKFLDLEVVRKKPIIEITDTEIRAKIPREIRITEPEVKFDLRRRKALGLETELIKKLGEVETPEDITSIFVTKGKLAGGKGFFKEFGKFFGRKVAPPKIEPVPEGLRGRADVITIEQQQARLISKQVASVQALQQKALARDLAKRAFKMQRALEGQISKGAFLALAPKVAKRVVTDIGKQDVLGVRLPKPKVKEEIFIIPKTARRLRQPSRAEIKAREGLVEKSRLKDITRLIEKTRLSEKNRLKEVERLKEIERVVEKSRLTEVSKLIQQQKITQVQRLEQITTLGKVTELGRVPPALLTLPTPPPPPPPPGFIPSDLDSFVKKKKKKVKIPKRLFRKTPTLADVFYMSAIPKIKISKEMFTGLEVFRFPKKKNTMEVMQIPKFLIRKIKYKKGRRVGKFTKVTARTKEEALIKTVGFGEITHLKLGQARREILEKKKRTKGLFDMF